MRPMIALSLAAFVLGVSGAQAVEGLSETERLTIERDCARLEHQFAYTLDVNDVEGFANLFSDTGTMAVVNSTTTGGVAAMRKYMQDREIRQARPDALRTTHVMTNIVIDVKDRDHASGTLYEVMYRYDKDRPQNIKSLAPVLLGVVNSEYVRTSKGWRIQSHVLKAVTAP